MRAESNASCGLRTGSLLIHVADDLGGAYSRQIVVQGVRAGRLALALYGPTLKVT